MMDEFIHWLKPYLPLLATGDEKSLGKWLYSQRRKSIIRPKIYKEWQITLG